MLSVSFLDVDKWSVTMEVGLVLSGCSEVRFCLAVWLGSLAVDVITSDLLSPSSLTVSIMPSGDALSNDFAAGGAAFASSLGVGLGVHRVHYSFNN